jgi:hypothetical protein
VGRAKIQLGVDAEAVAWFRRSIEANRSFPPHIKCKLRHLASCPGKERHRTWRSKTKRLMPAKKLRAANQALTEFDQILQLGIWGL